MSESLTHRDLCRIGARWLTVEHRMYVAGYEVALLGRRVAFDAVGVSDPQLPARLAAAARARKPGSTFRRPTPHRIVVLEAKRTAKDLAADLRAGKMLGYARVGTMCALVLGPGVLTEAGGLRALAAMGLPPAWGVYEAERVRAGDAWHAWGLGQRRPMRRLRLATDAEATETALTVAHSMTWRMLREGLVRDEVDDVTPPG